MKVGVEVGVEVEVEVDFLSACVLVIRLIYDSFPSCSCTPSFISSFFLYLSPSRTN